MTSSSTETVAFFGASGGVGLAALKSALATGRRCIALCRKPSKLSAIISLQEYPNLTLVEGNAHDVAAVSKCLQSEPGVLVDKIITTIGGAFIASKLTIDDPNVCRQGMTVLLDALKGLRSTGAVGRPRIVACSTTGISHFGRDIPIAMIPLYHVMLKVPHEDKVIMEKLLLESGEDFTIVRPSLMVDNDETAKKVRVGVEDPKTGRESVAIGYTITKADAGKWIAQNLLIAARDGYQNKIAMITT